MFAFSVPALEPIRRVLCGAALFAALLSPTACGGKSETNVDAKASGGTGARAGSAGANNGGASSGAGTGSGGVAGSALDCAKVVCPALPTSCKQIVQKPGDCCPTCPDTGCEPCPDLICNPGSHSETAPGACCPSCVPDSPDACVRGQQTYAALRAALTNKYGSTGCQNSTDCSLVLEDNACAYTCNVALPTSTSSDFTSNLETAAATDCSTCTAPARAACDNQVAACVNGRCVGVAAL